MQAELVAWIRAHRDQLVAWNRWIARHICNAPPGYTLSAYSYKLEQAGKPWGRYWRPRIDAWATLLFMQADHCRKAYEKDSQAIAAGAATHQEEFHA
jgi:hypothetical protein